MILHALVKLNHSCDFYVWPTAIIDVWPTAIIDVYIYNHNPINQVCPAYVCFGSTIPRHFLKYRHVWVSSICP